MTLKIHITHSFLDLPYYHPSTKLWEGNVFSRFCSSVCPRMDPFKLVYFLAHTSIGKWVVTYRPFCSRFADERLSDFTVAVGETFEPSDFDPQSFTRCANVFGSLGQAETRKIRCEEPIIGRYVTVYLNNWNYLTICELVVHGHPVGKYHFTIKTIQNFVALTSMRGSCKGQIKYLAVQFNSKPVRRIQL